MSKFYSVKYPTRRWPVQVWSNILNMAGINSHILYKGIHTRKISRYTFLCNLVNDIREFTRPKVISTPVNPSTPSSSILITRLSLDNSEMTPTTPKRRRMTFNSSSSPQTASDSSLKENVNAKLACQVRECKKNKAIDSCNVCKKLTCGVCIFKKMVTCKKCCN